MIDYAIWDQTHQISDDFLRQYVKDTFFEMSLDFGDVIIHHDFGELLKLSKADHLVVFGSGHVAMNPRGLQKAIEDFCDTEKGFLVAGHILYRVNTYPFLHPQMFIINMKLYRALGCPMIGFYEESEVLDLHKPERSVENVHDDYTPLWLKPTNEVFSCVNRKFGWNLIHTSLNNSIPIVNLPYSIRQHKLYLYPTYKQHTLSSVLQSLGRDDLNSLPSNMNGNQTKYISTLLTPGIFCRRYLFNTEEISETKPPTPIKRIFGTASGFKLFLLWNIFGETADVVYYDHNLKNLEEWENIVQNWSGRDFEAFCTKQGYVDDFSKMQEVIDLLGGEDNLELVWQRFQKTNPRFIHCDIIRNPQPLLDELATDGNYVWYSNIFKFFESIRCYGMAGSDLKEQQFLKLLVEKAPDTYCSSWTWRAGNSRYEGLVKDAIT